jgi:excisionase family DNA binding protein
MTRAGQPPELLTPGEVAALFGVDPRTVTRWAKAGHITFIRTPGGHRRYRWSQLEAILDGTTHPDPAEDGDG